MKLLPRRCSASHRPLALRWRHFSYGLAAAWLCSGCALSALVGENPDAQGPVEAAVLPPRDADALPDLSVAPSDVPTPLDTPQDTPLDTPQDVMESSDGVRFDRDVSSARLDVADLDAAAPDASDGAPAGTDGALDGDADDAPPSRDALSIDAAQAADTSLDLDGAPMEDVALPPADTGYGQACRRDLDCALDPLRPFCARTAQRCAASP